MAFSPSLALAVAVAVVGVGAGVMGALHLPLHRLLWPPPIPTLILIICTSYTALHTLFPLPLPAPPLPPPSSKPPSTIALTPPPL